MVISHWVLVDRESHPLTAFFQCVALATEIRGIIAFCEEGNIGGDVRLNLVCVPVHTPCDSAMGSDHQPAVI